MKRIYYALATIGFLSGGYFAWGDAGRQPVYIYLFAKMSDHVNLEMSEDRLRHILPMVERYAKAHPEAHSDATVLFSGAMSAALQERNAQTHIADFVRDYARRGVIELGYDGTDEPTYEHRPIMVFSDSQSPEDRWKMRQKAAETFLAEARDPLTGAPEGGAGGLKEMQRVFGPAACIRGLELAMKTALPPPQTPQRPRLPGPPGGLIPGIYKEVGGDTETLQLLRQYNTSAIMFGVLATNYARLPGFRTGLARFGIQMAPVPETAPEVYWQDNVLRISEGTGPVHPVKAMEGVEGLKGVLDKAGRSTVQVIQVELGSEENYLQPEFAKTEQNPALTYAYGHPQDPRLPADALRPPSDVSAAWAKEDELMKWLSEEYFPGNTGSRFVSSADLIHMAGASTGFSVSTEALRSELAEVLKKWGRDTFPPSYVRVEGHYLSLAELFQVMTDELAEFHRKGELPPSVKVAAVHGPYRMVTGHGPNVGELTVAELARTCAELSGALHDDSSKAILQNAVPPILKINGMDLNPAQALKLMAQALVDPTLGTALSVRMVYMLPDAGTVFPKSRPMFDVGFVWTMKPAPLNAALLSK